MAGQLKNRTITIASALATARERLAETSDTAGLEARLLLAEVLQQDKTWLLAHPEETLTPDQLKAFNRAVEQLLAGTPLPYLLGRWEFFGLTFAVTPEVLIPRPETELLVETALEWLARHPARCRAAEAGTGSGCIAISLAVNAPQLTITATDISPQALRVAGQNAARHAVSEQINFVEDDLLSSVSDPFDLICANLPYIPTETLHKLDVFRREPSHALDGGADGLVLIRRLLDQAVGLLTSDGLVLLEIEERQGKEAQHLAEKKFPGASIQVKPDLAGKPRLLVIER